MYSIRTAWGNSVGVFLDWLNGGYETPDSGISDSDQPFNTIRFPGFWLCGRPYGMYGPPPCCKRKVKIAGWSAQMYPVFE
jgi:hypothetical protein